MGERGYCFYRLGREQMRQWELHLEHAGAEAFVRFEGMNGNLLDIEYSTNQVDWVPYQLEKNGSAMLKVGGAYFFLLNSPGTYQGLNTRLGVRAPKQVKFRMVEDAYELTDDCSRCGRPEQFCNCAQYAPDGNPECDECGRVTDNPYPSCRCPRKGNAHNLQKTT